MIRQLCTVIGFVMVASVASIRAQAIVPNFFDYQPVLGGSLAEFTWSGLSSTNYPGYPANVSGNFTNWPSPIQPVGGNPNILLGGTPGFENDTTDFLSEAGGGGIYTFFSRTHFSITSSAPLAGLRSLVFQVYMAEGDDTGSLNVVGTPALSLTTTAGSFVVPANFSRLLFSEPVTAGGFDTDAVLLAYQWDLSGIAGDIQGYSLDWQVAMHSIPFGFDITESTSIHTEDILAVPEPASITLVLAGAVAVLSAFRRRVHRTARLHQ